MSRLRPELKSGGPNARPLNNEVAMLMIRNSVAQRRSLAYGRTTDEDGRHCAIGCFFADHPTVILPTSLVDDIAAINDSVPPDATPKERWKHVWRWLRSKTF